MKPIYLKLIIMAFFLMGVEYEVLVLSGLAGTILFMFSVFWLFVWLCTLYIKNDKRHAKSKLREVSRKYPQAFSERDPVVNTIDFVTDIVFLLLIITGYPTLGVLFFFGYVIGKHETVKAIKQV